MQIKPNTTIWTSHPDRLGLIGPLPEGVQTVEAMGGVTNALVFADDAASAREILTANREDLATPGVFWVAYPKANRADINRDTSWPILAEYGMRPNSQVAVDDVWS